MSKTYDLGGLMALQQDLHAWRRNNFPNSDHMHQFLGVVEEVGELSHAVLKREQGIRGFKSDQQIQDAIGDITIFLMNYASAMGFNFATILANVSEEVMDRDWISFPMNGVSE
jgi:NTP pyrophosphatase (non-canonical NTP hydrolase)